MGNIKLILSKKNINLFLILTIFSILFSHMAYAWKEVNCSSLKLSFKNNQYETYKCSKQPSVNSNAESLQIDNFNGTPYEGIYIRHDYFTAGNVYWTNDWAYQTLKNDNLRNLIQGYQLGAIVQLDSNATKLKGFGSHYKKYETDSGKGFIIARQDRSSIFSLEYYTDNPKIVIDEQLIRDLYSSINIPGIIKATYSNNNLKNENIKSSSNSKDDSQSENFLDFCKNSNIGDLSKEVAELCIEKLNKK